MAYPMPKSATKFTKVREIAKLSQVDEPRCIHIMRMLSKDAGDVAGWNAEEQLEFNAWLVRQVSAAMIAAQVDWF